MTTSPPFRPARAWILSARVQWGDKQQTIAVNSDDQEAILEFDIPLAATELQTWFITADGEEFGASYVYIERL